MTNKVKSKLPAQIEKFRQAARELGSDESEAAFNERLGKIARQKPTSDKKKKKPGK